MIKYFKKLILIFVLLVTIFFIIFLTKDQSVKKITFDDFYENIQSRNVQTISKLSDIYKNQSFLGSQNFYLSEHWLNQLPLNDFVRFELLDLYLFNKINYPVAHLEQKIDKLLDEIDDKNSSSYLFFEAAFQIYKENFEFEDKKNIYNLLISSSKQNNSRAKLLIGYLIHTGFFEFIPSSEGIKFLNDSAENLNLDAILIMGFLNFDGNFIPVNYSEAYYYFLLYKMITDNQYNFLKVNSFMKEIKEKLSNKELNSLNTKVKKMKEKYFNEFKPLMIDANSIYASNHFDEFFNSQKLLADNLSTSIASSFGNYQEKVENVYKKREIVIKKRYGPKNLNINLEGFEMFKDIINESETIIEDDLDPIIISDFDFIDIPTKKEEIDDKKSIKTESTDSIDKKSEKIIKKDLIEVSTNYKNEIVKKYILEISKKINANIYFPKDVPKKIKVEISLNINKKGDVTKISLVKSSGVPDYDTAIARAVIMSQPLPVPFDNLEIFEKYFSKIKLNFKSR